LYNDIRKIKKNKEKIAYKIADNVTVLLELNCRLMVRIDCTWKGTKKISSEIERT